MIDPLISYWIRSLLGEHFKIIANLWGIRDPLIGPIIAMIIIFAFYYLIILLGLEGSFGRLGIARSNVLKFLAAVIAIMLTFGLSGFAVLIFGNPFVASILIIIAILIYSRGKPKKVY